MSFVHLFVCPTPLAVSLPLSLSLYLSPFPLSLSLVLYVSLYLSLPPPLSHCISLSASLPPLSFSLYLSLSRSYLSLVCPLSLCITLYLSLVHCNSLSLSLSRSLSLSSHLIYHQQIRSRLIIPAVIKNIGLCMFITDISNYNHFYSKLFSK